jgi:hypothetical protein
VPAGKTIALTGFVAGLAALMVQFWLTVPPALQPSPIAPAGRNLFWALVFFFSFFTILTNGTLVFIYLSDLAPGWPLGLFLRPVTRGMMVGVMGLVTIFYHVLLSGLWTPEGLALISDRLLHYATTLIYWIWWARFVPHGHLRWANIPAMLLPTLIYFFLILARGWWTGEYPYFILEAPRLGYPAVFLNALLVAIGLAVLCAIAVGVDKLLARQRERTLHEL